jgi:hypothetical protein
MELVRFIYSPDDKQKIPKRSVNSIALIRIADQARTFFNGPGTHGTALCGYQIPFGY